MERRFWPIIIVLGALLIGGGVWWCQQTLKNTETSAPITPPVEDTHEDVTRVVNALPGTMDFSEQARDELQAEALRENETLKPLIESLAALQQLFIDTRNALKDPNSNTCQVIETATNRFTNLGSFALAAEQLSQDSVQDARDGFDAAQTEVSSHSSETWSTWLVRLSEAVPEDQEKQQKAVEKFQKKFGNITDEYDETIDETKNVLRTEADQLFALSRNRLKNEVQLTSNPLMQFTTLQTQCQEGKTITAASRQTFSNQLMQWEEETTRLRRDMETTQTKLLNLPSALIVSIEPKMKEQTNLFQEALETLKTALQS